MELKKKNVNKYLIFFLFTHLFIWTLVPSISNTNLPLDTIEALAWGNDFQLGYSKHPPLSAWFVNGRDDGDIAGAYYVYITKL